MAAMEIIFKKAEPVMIGVVVMIPALITSQPKTEEQLTAGRIIVKIGLLRAVVASIFKKLEFATIEGAVLEHVSIIPIPKRETAPTVEEIIAKTGPSAGVMEIM
jgi:hypothetical protein